MELRWKRGNFATGALYSGNLPVVAGTDKITLDINAGDNAVVSLSKRQLDTLTGEPWKNIVLEGSTMMVLVDDSKPWNSASAVLFAGWVNKIDGRIGDVVTCQVVGLREYLAARIISPFGKGGTTNPFTGITFQASTWQGVVAALILDAFKNIVSSKAQPPAVLGDVTGSVSGSGKKRTARLSDAETYVTALDEIRDSLSDKGTEYRFVPRFKSSAKNAIVWDVVIGSDTVGKINWDGATVDINLSEESFKHLSFRLNASSENIANRVIMQSKAGDEETKTGADYTVLTTSNGLPLFDTFNNPGMELETADLLERGNAILDDLKNPKGSASYEVKGQIADWLPRLGKKIAFTGGSDIDASGYSLTVRCTGINFSGSELDERDDGTTIGVDIMLPQNRYPRLPSSKSKSKGDTPVGGGGGGGGTGTKPPITSKPPENGPKKPPIFDPLEPPYIPEPVDDNSLYKVACGSSFSIAIAADGKLYSWGSNDYGELGNGVASSTPTLTPTQVGTDTDWDSVYAGSIYAFALKKDGSLWSWGYNGDGQLGFPAGNSVLVPTKTIENVATFWDRLRNRGFYVIKKDGTLWAAGMKGDYNSGFSLGLGQEYGATETWTQVGTKTDWVKLESDNGGAMGGIYSVLALDAQGVAWQWGRLPTNGGYSNIPILVDNTNTLRFVDIYSASNSGGGASMYAGGITPEGILYTWGSGFHDKTGYTTRRDSPQPYGGNIGKLVKFLDIGTVGARPLSLMMVVNEYGELWICGAGHSWTIAQRAATPYHYGNDTGFDWRKSYFCRATAYDLLVIINDGELWAGGWNRNGSLGIGSTSSTAPFLYQINESDWKRLGTSEAFSLAVLKSDMYGAGINSSGQLGTGNKINYSSWVMQP